MSGFKRFRFDDHGALTVDWVVLACAMAGIGFGVVATIFGFMDAAQSPAQGVAAAAVN